jgi:hypothetical protein
MMDELFAATGNLFARDPRLYGPLAVAVAAGAGALALMKAAHLMLRHNVGTIPVLEEGHQRIIHQGG